MAPNPADHESGLQQQDHQRISYPIERHCDQIPDDLGVQAVAEHSASQLLSALSARHFRSISSSNS